MCHSKCSPRACVCIIAVVAVLAAIAGGLLYAFLPLPYLRFAVIAMLVLSAAALLCTGAMLTRVCTCGCSVPCLCPCGKAIPITAAGTVAVTLFLLAREFEQSTPQATVAASVNILNAILAALATGFFAAMLLALVWYMVCAFKVVSCRPRPQPCYNDGSNG